MAASLYYKRKDCFLYSIFIYKGNVFVLDLFIKLFRNFPAVIQIRFFNEK